MPGRNTARRSRQLASLTFLLYSMNLPLSADSVEIPFKLAGHLILLQGSIAELEDLNLLLDTGATNTMISRPLARRLRVGNDQVTALSWGKEVRVRTAHLDQVQIGGTRFEPMDARVGDLPVLNGVRIDGLLGLDLLRRTSITIDYERKVLIFGSSPKLSQFIGFYPGLPFLPIKLKVQERILTLILDTGAPGLILFEDEIDDGLELVRTKDRERIEHISGRLTLKRVLIPETHLAETDLGTVTAYTAEIPSSLYGGADGILAPTSLGLKRIHLDFMTNRIGWEP